MKPLKTERIENGNLMVSVAVSLNWRGNGNGRRFITPDGTVVDASREAFLAAVARGRRWQRLMDEGAVTSIRDIGQRIGREPSYVARIIRLSNLAPEIIEHVVAHGCPVGLSANSARKALPELWADQIEQLMK